MRILLVGDYPHDPQLGSAKVPCKLREEFQRAGHTCHVLFAEDLGGCPREMHLRQACAPWFALRAIQSVVAKEGPFDVVDVASAEGWIFGLFKRLRGNRTALVCRSHGLEHLNYARMLDDHKACLLPKPWTRRLWYPVMRLSQVAWAARLSDAMIVLNETDRAFVLERRWKSADAIQVVEHGVSDAFLTNAIPDGPRGQGLLFCGTWTGMKGVDYLAPSFAKVARKDEAARLTILGGAVPDAQIAAAFPEDVRPRVRILNRLPEEEVIRHYREHDALVFCSTYEGFGMVALEAMSQGLPVIATPVGCARQLIKDGETGLLVPLRNVDALAEAMHRMMADANARRGLAQRGWEKVRYMSWARTSNLTLRVYEKALETVRN